MTGRGDIGTPTGSPPQGSECQKIYKPINLLSPVSELLSKINIGDELEFQVVDNNGQNYLQVVYKGETAGSVTRYARQIIDCIEKGHNYVAVIISLDGGSCVLEARMDS